MQGCCMDNGQIKPAILQDKHIFVVEDDVTNMAIMAVLLRTWGAYVIQDHWNSATIDMLMRHQPLDLILLDLMLRHGVSGYDIFREIKKRPALANIPIVAVSAADPGIEIPRAQEMGFNGFIGKPLDPRKFPQQVLQCIEGKSLWEVRT
jgi:two-component system, cell cycle response regulator DivK